MHRLRLRLLSVRPRLGRLRQSWLCTPPTPEPGTRLTIKGWPGQIWISLVCYICFVFLSLISYDQNRLSISSLDIGLFWRQSPRFSLMNVAWARLCLGIHILSLLLFSEFWQVKSEARLNPLGDPILIIFGNIWHPSHIYKYTLEMEKICFHSFPPPQVWGRRCNGWPWYCQVYTR